MYLFVVFLTLVSLPSLCEGKSNESDVQANFSKLLLDVQDGTVTTEVHHPELMSGRKDIKTVYKLVHNNDINMHEQKMMNLSHNMLEIFNEHDCPASGWCLTKDGTDQDIGLLEMGYCSTFYHCLSKCQAYKGATGCEWHSPSRTCSVHTHEVDHGSGDDEYYCWPFSKCKGFVLQSRQTDGFWGLWGGMTRCPINEFVYGYRLRSEAYEHSNDDTALNSIELQCAIKGNGPPYTTIRSRNAGWGTFSSFKYCSGADNVVTGFNMRMEPPHHDDDTAANDVDLFCKDGGHISATVNTDFGKVTPTLRCPNGYAVMGISTRVQGYQGGGDDTALNGVMLLCQYYGY